MLGSTLCIAQPCFAQAPPFCTGDCNGDGAVSISELVVGVNIALERAAVAACPSFDDDGNGRVAVNELIRSVAKALTVCVFAGDSGGEAASGVVSGVVNGYGRLRFGSLGGGTGASAPLDTGAALGGQMGFCSAGMVETSCSVVGGSSIATSQFESCSRKILDNVELRIDGALQREVADEKFCETLVLQEGVAVVDTTDELQQSLINTVTGESSATVSSLVRSYVFRGEGCEQVNGDSTLDGTLEYRCEPGSGMSASCPPEGENLLLRAEALQLTTNNFLVSFGDGVRCIEGLFANGRLDSRDRISGARFNGVFRDLDYQRDPGTGTTPEQIRVDGLVAVDCLGEIGIVTEVPLSRVATSRCPLGGLVFVEGGDFFVGVDYTGGGASFDFDADGSPDRVFASCEDSAIDQCF